MILKFNDFIKESIEIDDDSILTKRQLKRLKYFVKKENTIIEKEELDNFDIPTKIKEHMKSWDIIVKSPYSDSFYSSLDIDWGHKPENSFRVSDHWNFTSLRDGKEKKHCRTNISVPTTSHLTLAQYKNGIYNVLITEPTNKHLEKIEKNKVKLKYLMDPDTIYQKKLFKNRVLNGEVFGDITIKGNTYKGRIFKYTGQELKIVDSNNKMIYNENYLQGEKYILNLYDINGNKIKDILKK